MTSESPRYVPEQCLDSGEQCISCPYLPDQGNVDLCGYLQRGIQARRDRETAEDARHDEVIPGFLTMVGIKETLRDDPVLTQQFIDGTVGVAVIDLRGLKAVNRRMGYKEGNRLLQIAGERMLGLRRTHFNDPPPESDKRSTNKTQADRRLDVCSRTGDSDELTIIMPHMRTEEDIRHIVQSRLAPAFSINQAIYDSRNGSVPIVAHTGYAYAANTGNAGQLAEGADALARARYAYDVFDGTLAVAKAFLKQRQAAQYEEMWGCVVNRRSTGTLAAELLVQPSDERMIINTFWEVCCPDFIRNATTLLSPDTHDLPRG